MATKRETKKANTDAILRRATERINLKMAVGELRGGSTLSQFRLGQIERISSFTNSRLQARQQLNRALSLYGKSGLSSILLRYYAPTVAQYSVLQRTLRLRRQRPVGQAEIFVTEDYAPTSPSLARPNSTTSTPAIQYEYFDEPEIIAPSPMPMAQRIVQRNESTTPSNQFASQIAERGLQKATVSRSRNFTPAVMQGIDNTARVHRQIDARQPSSAQARNIQFEAAQPATQVSRQMAQNPNQTTSSANSLLVNSDAATLATPETASSAPKVASNTEINRQPANLQSSSSNNVVSRQSAASVENARAEVIEREVAISSNPSQSTPLRAALQRLDSDFVSGPTPQIAPALLLTHRLNRLATPATATNTVQASENRNTTSAPVQRQLETSVAQTTVTSSNSVTPNQNVNSSSSANSVSTNSQTSDSANIRQANATQPANLNDSPMYRAVARSSTQPTQSNPISWVNRLPIIQQTLGSEPAANAPAFEPEAYASEVRRSYLEPHRPASVEQSVSAASTQVTNSANNSNTNSSQVSNVGNNSVTSQPTAQISGSQQLTSASGLATQSFGQVTVNPDATLQRITALNVASVSPMRRAVQRLNSDFVEASPEVAPAMLLSHRLNKMLPATQSHVLTSNQTNNVVSRDLQASTTPSSNVVSNSVQRVAGAQTPPSSNTQATQANAAQAFTVSNINSPISAIQPNTSDQNFAATEANSPLNLVQRRVSNETPAMLRAMERTNVSSAALTTSAASDWASSLPALQQLTATEPISSSLSQPVATTASSASEIYPDSPRRSLPQSSRAANQNSNSASSGFAVAASTQSQNTIGRDFAATTDITSTNRSVVTPALTPIQRAFARTNSAQAISTTQRAVQQILTLSNQAAATSNKSVKAEPNTTMAAAFERSKSDYAPTTLMQNLQRMTDQQPNAINQQQAANYTYTTPPLLLDMASTNYQPPKVQPVVVPTASTESFVAGQNLPPLASQSVSKTPAIFSKPVSPMTAAEKSAANTENATPKQSSASTEPMAAIQRTSRPKPQQELSAQANTDAVVLPSRFERTKVDPTAKLDDGTTPLAMTQLNANQTEASHKIGEVNSQNLLGRSVETNEPTVANPSIINRTLGQTTNPETVTPPSSLPMAQLKPSLSSNEVQENISRLLERQMPDAKLDTEPNSINRTLGPTPNADVTTPLPMSQLKPNTDSNDMSEDMLLQAIQNLGKSRPEIMRKAIEKSAAITAKPIEPIKTETASVVQSSRPTFDPETFASSVPSSPVITPRFTPAIAVEGQVLPMTMVQRKANGSISNSIGVIGTPTVPTIMRASGGQPLPGAIQRKMGETFGAKFDHVRVHTDSQAVTSAQQMGAEAYTVGSNIFFNAGRYQPESPSGQALIAHELTHVVQQAHLPSLGNGKVLETSTHGQDLEREAIHNEKLMLNHLTTSQPAERTRNAGQTTLSVSNNSSAPAPTIERTFSPNDILRMAQSGQLQKFGTTDSNSQTANPNISANANPTVQRIVNPVPSETSPKIERILGKPTEAAEQKSKQEIELGDEEVERLANKIYRMLRERLTIDRERHGVRGNIFH